MRNKKREQETSQRPAIYLVPAPSPTFVGMSYAQIGVLAMAGVASLSVLFALYSPIFFAASCSDRPIFASWIFAGAINIVVYGMFTYGAHRPRHPLSDRFIQVDDSKEVDLEPKVAFPLQGAEIPPPEAGDSVGTIRNSK